ncbi:MAG TPA: dihydroorotase [Firmicutes bacterium]|nr:dihydroorotase [Bacillota bacterium]
MVKTLIKNGRLVDPANGIDDNLDVLCVDGKVAQVGRNIEVSDAEVIDASGKVVAPGLVDIHCHLRIPGNPEREDLKTGSRGAALGGFTTLVPLPNTRPVTDNPMVVEHVRRLAARDSIVNIIPAGAITKGEEGQELSPMAALAQAGVPIFSDDGQPVANADLMRRALEYSQITGRALSVHSEDKSLTGDGAMNAGALANRLGYPGIPSSAETVMVARDIVLSKETGGHVHVCHVGYGATVDIIRFAKSWGANVTAEVTPHHFTLTEAAVAEKGTNAKINPPLAGPEDVEAIKKGLKDGTIDVIITDHAPYTPEEKSRSFTAAPFGLIGFETALSLVISELVDTGVLTLSEALAKLTINPCRILVGVDKGHLSVGADADLIVIDLNKKWVADPDKYQSKSRNCPYGGRTMKGKVDLTMVGGRIVVRDGALVV